MTIIPKKVAKSTEPVPSSQSFTQLKKPDTDTIYTYSATSPKPYGDHLMDMMDTLTDTINRIPGNDKSLIKDKLNKLDDHLIKTIANGSITGKGAKPLSTSSTPAGSSGGSKSEDPIGDTLL